MRITPVFLNGWLICLEPLTIARLPELADIGLDPELWRFCCCDTFETVGVQKVVFKTEALNTQSRTAILALGASEEGTFRRHLITDNGRMRDMVYCSILDSEWPSVCWHLQARLSRYVRQDVGARSGVERGDT